MRWRSTQPRNGNGRAHVTRADATVAFSRLVGKIMSDAAFYRGEGSTSEYSETKPLEDAYSQVAIVYACIEARARALSQCPLKVYTRNSEGELEETTSPFDDIVYRPNPITSRFQFISGWETNICRDGEAFVLLDRANENAIPAAMWLLPPSAMSIDKADHRGVPEVWEYDAGSKKIKYESWQIAHDKLWNPDNPSRGRSPLLAANIDIEQEWDVTRWNRGFLINNCDPGGRYELAEGGAIDPEQSDAIMRRHGDRVAGPSKTGMPMIDMGGLSWKPAEIPHKDMSFEQQRDFNLRAVKMVLGVPTIALGMTEGIPYAAARAQMKMFWSNTLIPRVRSIEDVLWASMTHSVENGKYEVLFDLEAVEALRDDITERLDSVKHLFDIGVPVQEINRVLNLGLEDFEGWEDSYLPGTYVEMGAEPEPAPAPAPPPIPEKAVKEKVSFEDFSPDEIKEAETWTEDVLRPNEKKFHGKVRSYFFEHRNATLRRFADATGWDGKDAPQIETKAEDDPPKFDPDAILPDDEEMIERLRKGVRPIYDKSVLDAAGNAAAQIGTEAQITMIRGELSSWVETECLNVFAKRIPETLKDELMASLRQGIEKGETIYDLAGRIKHVHKGAQNRSMTIARTEVGKAASKGQIEEFKESGVVEGKRWNAALDGATRPSHRALHRQTVGIDEDFVSPVSGVALAHPHAAGAPAEEVCNCRCVVRPVLSKE